MKNILLAKKISQLKNNSSAIKVLSIEEQNQVKGGSLIVDFAVSTSASTSTPTTTSN